MKKRVLENTAFGVPPCEDCGELPCQCEFVKVDHECGICSRRYHWSTDDIAWEYEASPFMPCGHKWDFLDRVVE